jgi:hypothetical protein
VTSLEFPRFFFFSLHFIKKDSNSNFIQDYCWAKHAYFCVSSPNIFSFEMDVESQTHFNGTCNYFNKIIRSVCPLSILWRFGVLSFKWYLILKVIISLWN